MSDAVPSTDPFRRTGRSPARRLVALAALAAVAGAAGCSSAEDTGAAANRPVVATSVIGTTLPATAPGATEGSAPPGDPAAPGSTAPGESPAPTPPPRPRATAPSPTIPVPMPRGATVLVIGDSVTLGAKPQLAGALAGWQTTVDAQESRFPTAGPVIVRAARASGRLGSVLVVQLCNNYSRGGGFARLLAATMDQLDAGQRAVWVTCAERTPGQTEANAAIRDAAARDGRIVVADWAGRARTAGYTYPDGLHLQPAGAQAFARLIGDAIGPAPR